MTPIITALFGAAAGAMLAWYLPRRQRRRQVALQLLEQFMGRDFWIARAQTWQVLAAWRQGDRSIVGFFVSEMPPQPEDVAANGLTPHQNLSWLLHFYVAVESSVRAGLVDEQFITDLLQPHYQFYEEFFSEFRAEYRIHMPADRREPSWLTALPRLERVFNEH